MVPATPLLGNHATPVRTLYPPSFVMHGRNMTSTVACSGYRPCTRCASSGQPCIEFTSEPRRRRPCPFRPHKPNVAAKKSHDDDEAEPVKSGISEQVEC